MKESSAFALSTVEVEALRQFRTRLNKPASSPAARAVLGKAFLDLAARVGIAAEAPPVNSARPPPAALIRAAEEADMAGLGRLSGLLASLRLSEPRAWSDAIDAGLPQAILSRRLALAGREPAKVPSNAPGA